MAINKLVICGAWLGFLLPVLATAAEPGGPAEALAKVQAVPRQNQWTLVDPQQRPVLKTLVQMPAAERDRLLSSDDARLRGIGIFITEQQGDIARLLSLSPLLSDNSPTVAYFMPVAHPGEYPTAAQTVAEYLTTVYLEWFGVDVDRSQQRFDELLGPGQDRPADFVQPWIVQLRRAADDAARTRIKENVGKLPEEVRWAVLTLGYSNSLYTKAEAGAQLAALSPQLRENLRARLPLLPNEPLFHSTSFRAAVMRVYGELSGS